MNFSSIEKQILNLLQKDIEFDVFQFDKLSRELNIDKKDLMNSIKKLKADGAITRIGPFFNLDKSSGYFSLIAMKIPSENFNEVAEVVNSYEEVAHNYQRENEFNMWFVLACNSKEEGMKVLDDIELKTGYKTYNFPKLEEIHLNLFLEVL